LADLAIIPAIFIVQTLVSYACSIAIAAAFGFPKRPRNFVIAMGVRPLYDQHQGREDVGLISLQVFGNSNSLPISLVLSLSQTIKGLHWDKRPGDNDDEVAARGILYLLIFQQLGQLVRWSWGYNVLLAPPDKFADTAENTNSRAENGEAGTSEERDGLIEGSDHTEGDEPDLSGSDATKVATGKGGHGSGSISQVEPGFHSGDQTPVTHRRNASWLSSRRSSIDSVNNSRLPPGLLPTPVNGNVKPSGHTTSFPSRPPPPDPIDEDVPWGIRGIPIRCRIAMNEANRATNHALRSTSQAVVDVWRSVFGSLPSPVQRGLEVVFTAIWRFLLGLWSFMNPPLWAMLAAIVVASIPELQRFFFADGTFFKNSVTSAIRQSGGVAVPLILVVLGGNLARNTLTDDTTTKEDEKEETKLLIASIVSRMLLPVIIMAPLLALTAKYVPVSILDDPIFVIVCFLITGAPSALQLAQICQINNVYMGAMSRLLFQSYVVWILPSTLLLVMCALEVVEWAQR